MSDATNKIQHCFSQEFTNAALVSGFCVGSAAVILECAGILTDLHVPASFTVIALIVASLVQLAIGGVVIWKECNRPSVRTAGQFFALWTSCLIFAMLIPLTAGGIVAVALVMRNNPNVRARIDAASALPITKNEGSAIDGEQSRSIGLGGLFADVIAHA